MAKLSEACDFDLNRQDPQTWDKIHLYKMGDFWRVYEWSAWLISTVTFNDEVRIRYSNRQPLAITRMHRTDKEGTYCFVGFPIRSLDKFVPERKNFESANEKHLIITIELPMDFSKLTYEELCKNFNDWKNSIAIKDKKTKAPKTSGNAPIQPSRGGGILTQIIGYKLSEHTAIDNHQFILSLQQQVTSIL